MKLKFGFYSDSGLLNVIFFTKFIYVFLAEFVYSKFTQLGDTARYLNSGFHLGTDSTSIMDFLGFFAGKLPPPFYHLPMMLLSFYGVSYLVNTLSKFDLIGTFNRRCCLFFLVSLPSTGIWSSIHSKEAVGFFFVSIITSFLIKANFQNGRLPNFVEFLSIALCFIFKPQYMICFISLYSYISICQMLRSSAGIKFFILLIFVLVQILILYHFAALIDKLSFLIYSHFDVEGAMSTRENIFYEKWDFFKYAPYGMFIAFWGPTFQEALTSFAKSITFIESFALSSMLIYMILATFKRVLNGKFNVYFLGMLFFTLFWILLVHYPFGVFNPGSGIRYRTNFIPLLVGILFLTSNRSH
ncbi:hypothetical protein ACPV4Z_00320 [Vibrio aestuarianus]|uniref:hypothetical protein n=1 Tax=Vibrio aestuarianus TaxID=28171 RepID=UPI004068C9C7